MRYISQQIIVLILVSALVFASCTQDKGPIEPEVVLSTVSFQNDVQPIFDAACVSCHKTELAQNFGNLDLSVGNSYADLVAVVSDGFSPAIRVVAEDYQASVLWDKVNESEAYGSNMPLGAAALSQTEQATIKVWIAEGALDN